MRSTAREVAFEVIFSSRFTGTIDNGLKSALAKKEKLSAEDLEYLDRILMSVEKHMDGFSETVDKLSIAFPESRIFPADISILFIALAEILYEEDIPDIVSINEAANIASKYSSQKSASFISGILSEIVRNKNV